MLFNRMKYLTSVVVFFTILGASPEAAAQKLPDLAPTPPMGWSSWNKFGEDINENIIKKIADALVATGLRNAGYIYVNLDDCWHAPGRDADGSPMCHPEKFPSGIKALADYMHERGLKLGIYSDAGYKTCANMFGSAGHEYQDARQYAQWGVDYLKYDWCNTPDFNTKQAYTLMRDALLEAGRPILFSICEWGFTKPWEWGKDVGHMWRTCGDIGASFNDPSYFDGKFRGHTVIEQIRYNEPWRKYHGPGHWNDPDMLEVGNNLTVNQGRAHFTIWAMMAAPLILGNDIRSIDEETLKIVSNREVIAVDQDSLGVQGFKIPMGKDVETWWKPLADGGWAVAVFNISKKPVDYELNWQLFNMTDDEVSGRSTDFDKVTYSVRDLWNGGKPVKTDKPLRVKVGGEDAAMFRLTPIKK